jgi:hypothetical protein
MTAVATQQPAPRFANLRAAIAVARQQRQQVEDGGYGTSYDPMVASDEDRLRAIEMLHAKVKAGRGDEVDGLGGMGLVSNKDRLRAVQALLAKAAGSSSRAA